MPDNKVLDTGYGAHSITGFLDRRFSRIGLRPRDIEICTYTMSMTTEYILHPSRRLFGSVNCFLWLRVWLIQGSSGLDTG